MRPRYGLTHLALSLLVISSLAMAAGCSGPTAWTPNARLAAARTSFNGTVNTLADLRAQGLFTPEQAEVVTLSIKAGSETLDRWQAALELGQTPAPAIEDYNAILRELVAQRIAAERKQGGAQ